MADLPSTFKGVGFVQDVPFLQILPYLDKTLYQPSGDNTISINQTAAQTGLQNELGASPVIVSIDTYLTSYYQQPNVVAGSNPVAFPTDFASFINNFRSANNLGAYDPTTDPAYQGFLTEFINVLHLPGDIPGLPSGTDPSSPTAQLFQEAFADFLKTYQFKGAANFGGLTTFIGEWHDYLTRIALVQQQYQQAFQAYFGPNAPNASFIQDFQSFFNQQINNKGVFVPSQAFGDWLTLLRNQYTLSIAGSGSAIQTSVGLNTNSKGPLVITRILELLITLLNSVQQVAAAQATRLSFYTSWQRAYTDLLAQVRSFSKNGPEGLTDDDIIDKQLTRANQQYTSELQARQQVVSDDAKSLQSTVNNSQDIAQQQGSMITSFIQQLSSILSTIYR